MRRRISLAVLLVSLNVTLARAADPNKSKESYVKKTETEVQDWTAKLKSLQERSEKSGSKTREEFDRKMKSIDGTLDEVRKELKRMQVSTDVSWKSMRHGIDEALHDLKKEYRQAASYFEKKDMRRMR